MAEFIPQTILWLNSLYEAAVANLPWFLGIGGSVILGIIIFNVAKAIIL